ncbi:trifunctional MMPL family transporter/lysophospholipid acyltransferase/class I SAM-dependent methyltransferase [Marinigracilibium pacificum]|uniref:MMPL family transporter n=1 Tax=Marinigracilibium pacificum TaxID=2729599 RepID=A0A848J003_9BACT|nr:trifunctional MMPL family transporter/lysophospholipid acyltransferase/class I SAM-dependent methyltransferase [Marinigracilibium pacificum]NMM47880.1 MMPL family transporter [Marinigracilibium pacificum]
MNNFFFFLYQKTEKYRRVFIGLLVLLVCMMTYVAFQVKLEENILNLVPNDKSIVEAESVLNKLKMNEQIVVHIYSDSAEAESLIRIAHEKADSIRLHGSEFIDSVRLEFSDASINSFYEYYLQHIPFYLNDEDYKRLEDQVSEKGIEKTVSNNLKNLMSPVGMVTKQFLLKDPFGMVGKPLQRMRDLNKGGQIGLYKNHVITEDQKHLIFFIDLKNSASETRNNGELIDLLENISGQIDPGYHFEYFGKAAVAVGNAKQIKNDILLTVNLALVVIFIFVGLFYRNLHSFFLILLPGAFGGLMGVAFLVMIRPSISVISLGIGSVLIGITLDFALHLITHYQHEKNVKQLFSDISLPILISSLTTSSAFFCLLFIGSRALQDLGLFAGVSVLFAALFTLIVLPHLVVRRKNQPEVKNNFIQKLMDKVAAYPFHKKKIFIGLFILVTTISLFTWRNYEFESDMLNLNYMSPQLREYQDNLNDISDYTVNNVYLVTSGVDIWEAIENNDTVVKTIKEAQEDSLIIGSFTVNDLLPGKEEQELKLKRWNEFWQDHSPEKVIGQLDSQAINKGFKAGVFNGLANVIEKEYNGISTSQALEYLDHFGGNMVVNFDGKTGIVSNVKLSDENKLAFIERVKDLPGVIVLDQGHFTRKLVTLLNRDFSFLFNISLIVVFLIIFLSYGRIELALITFAPIALSWLWTLGVMGLFGLKFNIINIIICTFIFGLGIDYSIFMVRGLTQKYKYNKGDIVSFKQSIILSAITTLVGIGVLIFAGHPALKSIALLAIIGIVSVILLTFIIPPILYDLLIQKRKDKGNIPFTFLKISNTFFGFSLFVIGCLILAILIPIFKIPIGSAKMKKRLYHKLLQFCGKVIIFSAFIVNKRTINKEILNFKKPSIIIANHHSFMDILVLLALHHKIVMVTNDWVYNSPFFGKVIQYADFILSSDGIENQVPKINELIKDGYSILIFPEGTRQPDFKLGRFKKGAFYLADLFNLDIQPILLHGTNYILPKRDSFFLKSGTLTIKALPRISFDDLSFGEGYSQRTKKISKFFKVEYDKLRNELEYPEFFKDKLISNYIYKGPVIEWYLRIKYKLEGNYKLFHDLVPKKGKIVDVGCGYGLMSYALAYSSSEREVIAIDYDDDKISVAQNCPDYPQNIKFYESDVVMFDYSKSDAFIVSDVLHYLTAEKQLNLLKKLTQNLNEGGRIIIRDGDREKVDRHNGTKLTEYFSTGTGFNKTENKLNYIAGSMIKEFADEAKLKFRLIDNNKLTSNIIFVMEKVN